MDAGGGKAGEQVANLLPREVVSACPGEWFTHPSLTLIGIDDIHETEHPVVDEVSAVYTSNQV